MNCPHILSLSFYLLAITINSGEHFFNSLPRLDYGLMQGIRLFLIYKLF